MELVVFRFGIMKHIKAYIGKSKVIDEKRQTELSQQEIREVRNKYETHNTWVVFVDIRRYPNDLDMVEYHFERRKKV